MIQKDSKRLKFRNDSKRYQKIPNDSKRFQTTLKDSQTFQMSQKDSKRLKKIPMDSKDKFERIWMKKKCKTFEMDKW